jgi:hypothetical protein
VVVNKAIIRIFTACSVSIISSMVFDECGLMAIACRENKLVKLFYSNGTYTTKSLGTANILMYVGFDSKGRFVMSLKTILNIYY